MPGCRRTSKPKRRHKIALLPTPPASTALQETMAAIEEARRQVREVTQLPPVLLRFHPGPPVDPKTMEALQQMAALAARRLMLELEALPKG